MQLIEKDLEDMICLENTDELRKRGLNTFSHEKLYRQFNLGAYGIADLVGISTTRQRGHLEVFITIYELKKDQIGFSALGQICRYQRAFDDKLSDINAEVEITNVLIGSSIEMSSNFIYAAALIPGLICYTYTFDITGLNFNEQELISFVPGNIESTGIGALRSMDFEPAIVTEK